MFLHLLVYWDVHNVLFLLDVSIDFYENDKQINDINSKPNLNSLFSYITSQLVLNHKSKHILLPIINIDCKYDKRFMKSQTA